MPEEEKKLAIALPGEWALQKVFGPALTEVGEDLKKLYAKGRDRIIAVAYRKVSDPDDGRQANLRVTRDVLWNGAFTDDEVCAEYFGGILASSRTPEMVFRFPHELIPEVFTGKREDPAVVVLDDLVLPEEPRRPAEHGPAE